MLVADMRPTRNCSLERPIPARTIAVLSLTVSALLTSCALQTARPHVPENAVIAHRGLPYWAPEETAPSYMLARALGVDYLEADLQRTKDGVIICLHDENLKRTTDISDVFPSRRDDPANTFTLEELKTLDAGSWFKHGVQG